MSKKKIEESADVYENKYGYKQRHAAYGPKGTEENDEQSMTIPNDAYTIDEIIKRSMSGMPAEHERNVMYFDQEDLDKINEFYTVPQDFTDLDRLREQHQEQAKMLERAMKAKEELEQQQEEERSEPLTDEEIAEGRKGGTTETTEDEEPS